MKAIDWVEKLKVAHGIQSDYAAAKMLRVTRNAVSNYRNKPDSTFDVVVAVRVAELLNLTAVAVIVDQVIERSKCADTQALLREEARRLCILCKVSTARKKIATGARPTWASAGFQ